MILISLMVPLIFIKTKQNKTEQKNPKPTKQTNKKPEALDPWYFLYVISIVFLLTSALIHLCEVSNEFSLFFSITLIFITISWNTLLIIGIAASIRHKSFFTSASCKMTHLYWITLFNIILSIMKLHIKIAFITVFKNVKITLG